MKVIVANLVVAGVAYGWWCRAGREWFMIGLPYGLVLLAFGVALGIWCNQPAQRPKRRVKAGMPPPRKQPDNSVFEDLTE